VEAADNASLHAAIFGEGEYVLERGSNFGNTIISNNQIRIADGDLMMQGRHIRLNEGNYVDLTVDNGQQGMNRNDLVVVRYTKDGLTGVEDCNLVCIKGSFSSGKATDPEYTAGSIIHDNVLVADMPLYRIRVVGLSIEGVDPLFELRSAVSNHMANKNNPHGVTASQVGALPVAGGSMLGAVNMNGNPLHGLKNPSNDDDAATMGFARNASNLNAGTVNVNRLPTVPVTRGGTGLQAVTSGRFLVGTGTSALSEKKPSEVLSIIGAQPMHYYFDPTDFNCTANSTPSEICTNLPNSSVFVCAVGNLTNSGWKFPSTIGLLRIEKFNISRISIVFYGKTQDIGDYRMFQTSTTDNSPSCVWVNESSFVTSGTGKRSTTYTTADAFDCTYTKYGRIVIVSFAATMASGANTTWADYEVATGIPKARSATRGIVMLGTGNTVTCSVTTGGAIRVVSRETSVANKIVIGAVAYITAE
jgi:hypothetical protein